MKLRRSLGQSEAARLDSFLVLDEFWSDDPNDYLAGFPNHPHRGFETVTYMLAGHMLHEDHLGNRGDLTPGSVQWMSAGIRPLDVHELVGPPDGVPAEQIEAIRLFEQGLDRFRERRFAEARGLFEQALERSPHDGPARRYLTQCVACAEAPPAPDWLGVYVQESK